ALGGDIRIDQGDHVAVVHSSDCGAALGAVRDLDVAPLEAVAFADIDECLAALLEYRLPRHLQRIGNVAAIDHQPDRRTRAEARIRVREGEGDVELTNGGGLEEVAARRETTERADRGSERLT